MTAPPLGRQRRKPASLAAAGRRGAAGGTSRAARLIEASAALAVIGIPLAALA